MDIDLNQLSTRERYAWMIGTILPRPIAFVSTLSPEEVLNLAPFSYFNGVSSTPPILSVAVGPKRSGMQKDTVRNVEATGELVVNVVTEAIAEAMVKTASDWASNVSEFDVSGLTPVASKIVRPPRVGESPVSFECRVAEIVKVGKEGFETSLILAEVVSLHVADEVLRGDMPDAEKIRPLARLGGDLYAGIGPVRAIPRYEMTNDK
jgi:flavin reductase (DIM6/NTAB) family NADH-FMN oxidoreductase RutF